MRAPAKLRVASRAVLLAGVAVCAGCASSGRAVDAWPFPVPPRPAEGGGNHGPTAGETPEAEPGQPPIVRPPLPPTPPPEVQPPLLNTYPHSIEASGVAAPVLTLVRQARDAKRGKKYDQAEAALERALRIEPRNPWVWQQLGSLHLSMGQGEQAVSEAKKSNSLARRNPWVEVENYRVIAAAASSLGDAAAASQAQMRYEDRQRWITTPPLATPNTVK